MNNSGLVVCAQHAKYLSNSQQNMVLSAAFRDGMKKKQAHKNRRVRDWYSATAQQSCGLYNGHGPKLDNARNNVMRLFYLCMKVSALGLRCNTKMYKKRKKISVFHDQATIQAGIVK